MVSVVNAGVPVGWRRNRLRVPQSKGARSVLSHHSGCVVRRRGPDGRTMRTTCWLSIGFLLASACGSASSEPASETTARTEGDEVAPTTDVNAAVSTEVQAAIDAPERTEADRELDPQRRPDLVFTFFGIQPGQRVADLFARRSWPPASRSTANSTRCATRTTPSTGAHRPARPASDGAPATASCSGSFVRSERAVDRIAEQGVRQRP